jgi:Na+/phosphate symporter
VTVTRACPRRLQSRIQRATMRSPVFLAAMGVGTTGMEAAVAQPIPAPLQVVFDETIEMLALTWASFRRHDAATLDRAGALGRSIHKREKELTELLVAGPADDRVRFVPSHLERIGDAVEGLIRCLRTMEAEGTLFTERGVRETNTLFENAIELLRCARDLALTGNRVLTRHIAVEGTRFHDLASDFAQAHEQRLIEGVCLARASSSYLAILDYLREVVRHTQRIADRVAGSAAPGARLSA